ncbi:MAG: hypothetical protein JXB07_19060 [Anaerolineae bacterium]|nr:hypothetical protein [Anaerolineae bacterium]
MDAVEINRAQYNSRDHRFDFDLSPRYRFEIELTLDDRDEPAYEITVSRKENGTLIGKQLAYSLDDAHGLVSEWWAQLSSSSRPLDMGANR